MTSISDQNPIPDSAFPISILPDKSDFAAARGALDGVDDGYVSSSYFQHYLALIVTCVQRGHRTMADIMAHVAPLVGPKNAVHLPWLIEILSGPACDVHLWEWNGPEQGRHFYGPMLELKPELESAASV